MAEQNPGNNQDCQPGDDQEDGPGENQGQGNEEEEEPAQASSSWERPSSSWERPGARPGNTPARQPLTEYKKWYNRNRPGKKERQEGAKARGIPPPPGVFKGCDAKGKEGKGKDKGKEKGKGKGKEQGKQGKGEQGKGKGQSGRVGGRTPPPPPPRKRPAAALVEPGDSQNPADEQDYSYYSTEEEGPQAKARLELIPNPAFLQQIRAGAEARRQGQAQGQVAAPQGPAGEPSSDGSSSDEEDDMPDTSAPNPGENQDRESAKRKEPPRSPTEPATSPREESHTPGEDQEEAAQPKPNPSEGTSPPEEPASPRATVEVNVGEPNPDPVSPGANQEQRKPEDAANQSAGAREETEPKEKETSPGLVEASGGDGSSCSWAAAREAPRQPQALHPEPDYNVTMTFTVQMRKDVNPCHSRYHPQVKVSYTDLKAGETSLELVVVGLGGSRIVTQAPHRPGVVWKLSTYPQDPEVKICRVFGAVTPGLIKNSGSRATRRVRTLSGSTSSRWRR